MIIFVFNFIGQIAQSVEQWTENPCVGGSIPSLPTSQLRIQIIFAFFVLGLTIRKGDWLLSGYFKIGK